MLVITEPFNIVSMKWCKLDSKLFACSSQVLVVTELVVSGCKLPEKQILNCTDQW